MRKNQARVPAGTPAGGQWAPTAHEDAGIELKPAHHHKFSIGAAVGTVTMAALAPGTAATTTVPSSHEIGIVPPANPATNCAPSFAGVNSGTTESIVEAIDICRHKEGVGPLLLPSNWSHLTGPEQLLVAVDLERVDRGEKPIVGLNSQLDARAIAGARAGVDPVGPPGRTWGSVWGSTRGALEDVELWMYDDGPGSFNIDCVPKNISGCWGHRDNLLAHTEGREIVAGASCAPLGCTMLLVWESAPVWFSWANESKYLENCGPAQKGSS